VKFEAHDKKYWEESNQELLNNGMIILNQSQNDPNEFRKLIGSTDPNEADNGTIRKKYALSKGENSVHGSDSNENAEIESNFHFS